MQNKLLSVLLASAAFACGARAQDTVAAPSAPPTPAPVAQAAQPGYAPAANAALQAPAPTQVIYSPRLPSANELTSVAAAQGLTIEQISQTATQVTVVTRNNAGQLATVAYQLLPNTVAPTAAPTATVVVPAPAPTTVIYEQSPRVIYYDRYEPYYPRYYYPPVSLNLGFGYYRGYGGGYGHYHGGHRWR